MIGIGKKPGEPGVYILEFAFKLPNSKPKILAKVLSLATVPATPSYGDPDEKRVKIAMETAVRNCLPELSLNLNDPQESSIAITFAGSSDVPARVLGLC